jgi:hypothetical protein
MSSLIQEIRAEQLRRQGEQPPKSRRWSFVAGAVAAFFAGGLLVTAWGVVPVLLGKGSGAMHDARPPAASAVRRMGRAEAAPLLPQCAPRDMVPLGPGTMVEAADLYAVLKSGGAPPPGASATALAALWGELADCVYRQNSWTLCQPDNRALAVETLNGFVRQLRIAAGQRADGEAGGRKARVLQRPPRGGALVHDVPSLRAIEDRVLAGLRHRVQEGRIVAADFGFAAAPAVKAVLGEVRPARDACADEGR